MKGFGSVWLGLAAAVFLAAPAMAQGVGGGMGPGVGMGEHRPPMEKAFGPMGGHGHWWNNPKAIEQLKLTEEQRKTFDGILLEHREKLIDLRASLEKAELLLEPLVRDEQPNEAKILAQIDKVAQARAELEKANARFLLAIRGKLTPEQWKQLQAFRAHRAMEHHGMEMGERGHGPNGPHSGGWNQEGRGMNHPHVPPPPPPPSAAADAPAAPGAGAEM